VTTEGNYLVDRQALVNNRPDTLRRRSTYGRRRSQHAPRDPRRRALDAPGRRDRHGCRGRSASCLSIATVNAQERRVDRPAAVEPKSIYRRLIGGTTRYWRLLCVAAVALICYAATDTGFGPDGPMLDEVWSSRTWTPCAACCPSSSPSRSGAALPVSFRSTMNVVARRVIATAGVFEHFLRLPDYYDRSSLRPLVKLTYNIEQVADSTTKSVTVLIRDSFTIVGLIGWMICIDAARSARPRAGAAGRLSHPLLGRRFRRYSGISGTPWAT
jgi:hypothetical protein